GMHRDAFDAQAVPALPELGRPVAHPQPLEIRAQQTGAWTLTKNSLWLPAKMDERQTTGLFRRGTDHAVLPVDVFSLQIGDVRLRAAQGFAFGSAKPSFLGGTGLSKSVQTREARRAVTVLPACWRALARVGVRRESSARFGARCGTL